MTVVLVHGVPETPRVWDHLVSCLPRSEIVALALPGFAAPLPSGFRATMGDYADWLCRELSTIDPPVHLVGHDWGGILTVRIVSTRPDLVASWVTDAGGVAEPRFAWHSVAKIWQTEGAGESLMESQLAQSPAARAAVLVSLGVPPDDALVMGDAFDRTMADCILSLYRSAVRVHEEWGPALQSVQAPGLVLAPDSDPFAPGRGGERAAARARATLAKLGASGFSVDDFLELMFAGSTWRSSATMARCVTPSSTGTCWDSSPPGR